MAHASTLVIDASGSAALLCLVEAGEVLASVQMAQRQQSRMLAVSMQDLCRQGKRSWSDVERFLYVHGPGSFTGLRIAAATLNGVNTALARPVAYVSSLAVSAIACGDDEPHWVLEDARAGEVFVGHYHGVNALQDDTCLAWSELDGAVIGDYTGTQSCAAYFSTGDFKVATMDRMDALAKVSLLSLSTQRHACPCYVQRSQAERNQDG
jgi:tRNA threonylcarbamoyladenosine biosynthesis protein TsaB